MQGKGWLVVGLSAAAAVWAADPRHSAAAAALGLPIGWPRFGLGAGLLAIGMALYFRSHWAASASHLRRRERLEQDTVERLERLASDLERSAWVIGDNLAEVDDKGRGGLFLDGARAHARKLPDLASRVRGIAERLSAGGDPGAPPRAGRDSIGD